MTHIEPATKVVSSTTEHFFPQLNLNALKKRWDDLTSNIPFLPKNEVGELLLRHYQDKSYIDEWSSWWHDLSVLRKSSGIIPIAGAAGLISVSVGFVAIPFLIIVTGLYYAAHKLLMHHEEHRRARGGRFVTEINELTHKLDEMLIRFKTIAAEMVIVLEQVQAQAEEMSKHNSKIAVQTEQLTHEQGVLHEIAKTVSLQTEQMQKARNTIIKAVENLTAAITLADSNLTDAVKTNNLDTSVQHFSETTQLLHQVELDIKTISNEINDFIQRASILGSASNADNDPEFENSLKKSQHALTVVHELLAQQEILTAHSEVTMTMQSKPIVEIDPESDFAYAMSRERTRNTLAAARAKRAELEEEVKPNFHQLRFL